MNNPFLRCHMASLLRCHMASGNMKENGSSQQMFSTNKQRTCTFSRTQYPKYFHLSHPESEFSWVF